LDEFHFENRAGVVVIGSTSCVASLVNNIGNIKYGSDQHANELNKIIFYCVKGLMTQSPA
jgi:hypothetical protein